MTNRQLDESQSSGSAAPILHMFQSASNIAITGGQFIGSQTIVQGPYDYNEARLDLVYKLVAPNAILNSGGRADEVNCYPGTREEVLSKSEGWMDAGNEVDGGRKGIFWLSGPAGAGKSAIVQTLAERCLASHRSMANFFFFRNDPTRNDARPLAATLLIQLFKQHPALKPLVAAVLTDNPLLFSQSIHDQFQYLIDGPIRSLLDASKIQTPIILLLDGLDECSSDDKHQQQSLLTVLHDLVSRDNSPFLVLVASRPEPHLIMSFNKIGSSADSIFLDDEYRPADDIRLFVTAELAEIKNTHHLGHMLEPSWPPESHIDRIVEKSSGQFIYAATVMRFIARSPVSPAHSLDRVRGLRPVTTNSPFADLDAIYTYILSHVEDWKSAKDVLTVQILISAGSASMFNPVFTGIMSHIGYEKADIPSAISSLTALVKFEDNRLVFY